MGGFNGSPQPPRVVSLFSVMVLRLEINKAGARLTPQENVFFYLDRLDRKSWVLGLRRNRAGQSKRANHRLVVSAFERRVDFRLKYLLTVGPRGFRGGERGTNSL